MALPKPAAPDRQSDDKLGPIYALLAYSTWGLLPIYWKLFDATPAVEVLSHRMIWSAVFLCGILVVQRRLSDLLALLRSPRRVLVLLLTASLLTFNWGLYIYGVNSDRVVEASLGYYINPLVTVLLGFVFLKERLYRGQQVAVALAVVGVGYFVWQLGTVPWIALALAISFAFYGLLRKVVAVAPLVGLAVETLLITPITLLFVSWLGATGQGHFGQGWPLTLLFVGAGVTTSMPLLWFNNAAKRLKLATLGFFQYLAPSLSLLLGVFVYGEPFTPVHVVTFSCIWAALLLYSVTALRARPGQV
ncbi:EamA family transporter RarD [Nodosilinea sp. LEGE 06152]|uniref:EamA family transporter RarD n=1 Tax=Nodosilinea sp. LEGE 06152 TaxID=2777966 RepID=UPI00187ED981|nr:EamA family transporter RarD [Nodosilinea sp. LEGE 06152]MBE9157246.1 EamA family transporter RarD [Nodosilinea sp. LEGE 06152]